jgi:hypothetical protein
VSGRVPRWQVAWETFRWEAHRRSARHRRFHLAPYYRVMAYADKVERGEAIGVHSDPGHIREVALARLNTVCRIARLCHCQEDGPCCTDGCECCCRRTFPL